MSQLFVLIGAVLFFEISSALVQEYVVYDKKFPYEWFSTLIQFLMYCGFAFVQNYWRSNLIQSNSNEIHTKKNNGRQQKQSKLVPPWGAYIKVGVVTVVARGFGNWAFQYMTFALKVLFMSSKPVVVIIVGVLFMGKRYPLKDYISTIMMLLGLLVFSIEDSRHSSNSSSYGVIIMTIAQVFDALKSEYQEQALRILDHAKQQDRSQANISSEALVSLWGSLIGTIITLIITIFMGQLLPGIDYLISNPIILPLLFVQYLLSYIASVALLSVIILTDAFTSSVVTTVRKGVSVVLSLFIFGNSINFQHVIACITFFAGVALNMYTKKEKTVKKS
eukprot:TRINITY_DN3068_c0_g1_i1.p1 TRINITY_DN3068_c0_g1~~TRINITY_DN3068_c0_g1_i1.p1  ORF type:complete len:334 (-),score=25.91 TRINITY_DN3068_c0_g1_i1:57-1058(-)